MLHSKEIHEVRHLHGDCEIQFQATQYWNINDDWYVSPDTSTMVVIDDESLLCRIKWADREAFYLKLQELIKTFAK